MTHGDELYHYCTELSGKVLSADKMYHHPACSNNEGGQVSHTWHPLEFLKKVIDVQQRSDGREMTEAEHEEMRLKRIQEKNRRNQRKFRARQRVSGISDILLFSLCASVWTKPAVLHSAADFNGIFISTECAIQHTRPFRQACVLLLDDDTKVRACTALFIDMPPGDGRPLLGLCYTEGCRYHAVVLYLCCDMLKVSDTGAGKAGGLRAACEGAEQAGHGPGACQGGVGGTQ